MSHAPTGLALYDRTADDAAAAVIARYSTSFALACRLLGPRVRRHVRNVYALVRVADEVVDGPAADAGLDVEREREVLDALERETLGSIESGFSANLVVHAFARTARRSGISSALVAPFFASMRTDLDTLAHDRASHDAYVYGSAEVVGLMCLQVFVNADAARPASPDDELVEGARRLGRAFQDVNFLRDLADDSRRLGRDYLDGGGDAARRGDVLDGIDADLAAAAAVVPRLPADCRRAVWTAHDLFAELSRRLRQSSAGAPRVRVPDAVKAAIAVRALVKAREAAPVTRRTVIVGGGIAGLATAALLAEDGDEVVVLEARSELGGRAGSWTNGGFRFDTGPSWYLMPEVFDHFFHLLGTSAEKELDLVRLDPAYRVYSGDAAPVDVVSGREASTALFESIEPGAGGRLDTYLDSAADAYRLAVSRFLYDPYTTTAGLRDPALIRRLPTLLPLLARTLSSHIERRFADRRLRQILGYPAVFLGGSPYAVPSLYHLMSHLDLDEGVLYPRGGFVEVIAAIERLARARGVRIETGAEVVRIVTGAGAVTGVETGDGRTIPADHVVSTADLHHTETMLLAEAERTYPESWWARRTPSFGALLLLLGVRGGLPQLAHHTLVFTEEWRENFEAIFGADARVPDPASLYVCRPSATDATVAPGGFENLFVLVPVPADPTIGHGGTAGDGDPAVEAAADRVIAQLAATCGIPDLAERVVVRRTISPADFETDLHAWRGNALGLAHTLGQSAMFRPRNASRRVAGLSYAGGSSLPGIGLPMCLISAELVVKRVRGDSSPGPLPDPAPAMV